MPKVSIGVPVYNGGSLLEDALWDLRRQTMADFEVIISDNASTDATQDIARGVCTADSRFRYIRQPSNIGPVANYRAVARAATAPLFLWRAYDDLSGLDYLEHLTRAAERCPDADVVAPRSITIRIGKAKKRVRPVRHLQEAGPLSPASLLGHSNAGWFYGLMRTDYALNAIYSVIDEYPYLWAWDHLMLFPAILTGRVAFSDEATFFHRLNAYADKASRPFDRAGARAMLSAYFRFCLRRIEASHLSAAGKARLKLALLRFVNSRVMPLRRLI